MSDSNIKESSAIIANKFLQDEIAKLRKQLEHVKHLLACESIKAERAEQRAEAAEEQLAVIEKAHELMTKTCMQWKERAEAAEAKLKALDEQKPFGYLHHDHHGMPDFHFRADAHRGMRPLYAHPPAPADVQELQARVAELDGQVDARDCMIQGAKTAIAELERKLAEAFTPELVAELQDAAREEGRKEAVPEGWQVVPKEPTEEMAQAFWNRYAEKAATCGGMWEAMLAAAPKSVEDTKYK